MQNLQKITKLDIYNQNVIAFFAGYIARNNIRKTNYNDCRNIIMKTPMDDATENEIYIEFREYPNPDENAPAVTKLVRPTELFSKVIEIQLKAFNRIWQRYWASSAI